MSGIFKIIGGTSIVLLLCTIICGLWMKYNPGGDTQFQFILSMVSVVAALITIILFMLKK